MLMRGFSLTDAVGALARIFGATVDELRAQ